MSFLVLFVQEHWFALLMLTKLCFRVWEALCSRVVGEVAVVGAFLPFSVTLQISLFSRLRQNWAIAVESALLASALQIDLRKQKVVRFCLSSGFCLCSLYFSAPLLVLWLSVP